ncbi:unnamed protein product [Periconia digitata]|uniref:Ubiquitin-protein ligase n=1 Tax=Periconia digitata TaxID=1303443 RepID=A0A9W4XZC7_9PLEO|nr:unnamed protein product [Periconia digitata]
MTNMNAEPAHSQAGLANLTSSFLPFLPRLLSGAGALSHVLDKMRAGSIIAEPTAANATNATIASTTGFIQESVAAAAGAAAGVQDDLTMWQTMKNVGSFFGYITSKWAIATFIVAILLNRTHFYASSRVPLSIDRLHMRLGLYLAPMLLFLYRIQTVLQAIRCQTAPAWSEMQYGQHSKQLDTDFGGEGGFLYEVSSSLLFYENVQDSCRAANMLPLDPGSVRPQGSLALLWPLFVSLGFSQVVETLSCALQGRHPVHEVGMTLFEHSLAFAEAEAVVTRPFASDSSRFHRPKTVFTPNGDSLIVARSALNSFANVPPEVLVIALISSFSHFTSNFLAILGFRARFRLVTTAVWGLAYMSTFTWSFFRFANSVVDSGQYAGIIRFPTVCIVGFIPHLLILTGILACGVIYLIAFVFTVLSPPPGQPEHISWRQRCAVAYGNLHANIHLSAITPLSINWNEDFYTAILKTGFTVLTAASEAVYLNEGTRVNVHAMTWLEKKRLREILARRRQMIQRITPVELRGDALAEGLQNVDQLTMDGSTPLSTSGYARERKTKGINATSDAARAIGRDNGVGLQQRRGRWTLTYQFLKSISFLVFAIQARLLMSTLQKLRITYRPRWLTRLAGPRENGKATAPVSRFREASKSDMANETWLFADDQTRTHLNNSLDLEVVARERLHVSGSYEQRGPQESEEQLNDYLYGWFKRGGQWGDADTSGDFVPPRDDDDDTTSVVSWANTTDDEDAWSDVGDGQRTPTQDSYRYSRESSLLPENTFDMSRLSQLLDPKSSEDREEAKLLSRHLQSSGVLTRSQYRQALEQEEARILTTSRLPMDGLSGGLSMTPEEEELLLEDLILNKRKVAASQNLRNRNSWDTGAEGMGSDGPQCVVCQMEPRTVLVWPCGCLSLCDDCRVGLASKNYTTCVCCRTNVAAYSRLYVP